MQAPFFNTVVKMKYFYVYILASKKNGTLYVGLTSHLNKRIWEHKNEHIEGFTIKRLVYFETYQTAQKAIERERQLKKWKRIWKLELIEKSNPHWEDLADSLRLYSDS